MTAARPDTWANTSPMKCALWPDKPGVYVIFFDGHPVYVGQSNNLRERIKRHQIRYGYARNLITPWGDFSDDVQITAKYRVSRRIGDWAMWEIRLIHKLQPKFNRTFTGARWKGAA